MKNCIHRPTCVNLCKLIRVVERLEEIQDTIIDVVNDSGYIEGSNLSYACDYIEIAKDRIKSFSDKTLSTKE